MWQTARFVCVCVYRSVSTVKFKRGKGLRSTEQDGAIVNACTDPKDGTENKAGSQAVGYLPG